MLTAAATVARYRNGSSSSRRNNPTGDEPLYAAVANKTPITAYWLTRESPQ